MASATLLIASKIVGTITASGASADIDFTEVESALVILTLTTFGGVASPTSVGFGVDVKDFQGNYWALGADSTSAPSPGGSPVAFLGIGLGCGGVSAGSSFFPYSGVAPITIRLHWNVNGGSSPIVNGVAWEIQGRVGH